MTSDSAKFLKNAKLNETIERLEKHKSMLRRARLSWYKSSYRASGEQNDLRKPRFERGAGRPLGRDQARLVPEPNA
jgi:hypothetical protein